MSVNVIKYSRVNETPVCGKLILVCPSPSRLRNIYIYDIIFILYICVHIVTCRLHTPFHYRTRGQGSSAALHMEYTGGRVSLPSRM